MVLFSGDLNIIQESVVKVGDKVARDYVELENLQNSYKSCEKFADMLIDSIKRKLFEYLSSKKPSVSILFQDESHSDETFDSDMRYIVDPLCGRLNLIHAIPYFSISVALQKKMRDGEYKTVCGVIDSPVMQETFMVEDGKGAYVNSRRLRVSARSRLDDSIVAIKNNSNKEFIVKIINKYKNVILTNCEALNICNVASGKYDIAILDSSSIHQDLSLLLVKEAGGFVKKLETGEVVVCNNLLYSQI